MGVAQEVNNYSPGYRAISIGIFKILKKNALDIFSSETVAYYWELEKIVVINFSSASKQGTECSVYDIQSYGIQNMYDSLLGISRLFQLWRFKSRINSSQK